MTTSVVFGQIIGQGLERIRGGTRKGGSFILVINQLDAQTFV